MLILTLTPVDTAESEEAPNCRLAQLETLLKTCSKTKKENTLTKIVNYDVVFNV